ncbi:MAG: hypothetical protein NUV56_01770, partial [Candidatus Uhrbacteria bacterium]|nr:hypothetical protein [Candidatus Uhrbacteria bacterium]
LQKATHGVIRRAPWLSLNAALLVGGWAFVSWMCWWMLLHAAVLTAGAPQAGVSAILLFIMALAAVLLSTVYAWRWVAVYLHVFLGASVEDGFGEPAVHVSWPIQASGLIVVLGALLAPSMLTHIGAEVLTLNIGLTAMITTGNESFAPALFAFVTLLLAGIISVLRGAVVSQDQQSEEHYADVGTPRILPMVKARVIALRMKVVSFARKGTAPVKRIVALHERAIPHFRRFHALLTRLHLTPQVIATLVVLAIIAVVAL